MGSYQYPSRVSFSRDTPVWERTAVGNRMHPTQMEPAASSYNHGIELFQDGARESGRRHAAVRASTACTLADAAGGRGTRTVAARSERGMPPPLILGFFRVLKGI